MFPFLAQAGDGAKAPGFDLTALLPFVLLFVIMYLLFIRPQRKQEARKREMLSMIQKNDRILTTGGIYGVVTNVKDDELTIRIDDARDVKVKVARSFVATVVNKKEGEEA